MAKINFNKAKIYKIFTDDQCFIGWTTLSIDKRYKSHISKAKKFPERDIYKHFEKAGWDKVKIEIIEDYPCESSFELRTREQYWIDELQPSLNVTKAIGPRRNHKNVPKTPRDPNKVYSKGGGTFNGKRYNFNIDEERREYQRLYHIDWYAKNKDKAKKYISTWAKDNREKFREIQKKSRERRSPEQIEKEKVSARTRAYTKYNYDDDYREKKRKINRERVANNEEVRKRYRAAYKERYKNNKEFKERLSKYNKLWREDPTRVFFGV
jgi:hypothetical protein